jgi:hypothetical protein
MNIHHGTLERGMCKSKELVKMDKNTGFTTDHYFSFQSLLPADACGYKKGGFEIKDSLGQPLLPSVLKGKCGPHHFPRKHQELTFRKQPLPGSNPCIHSPHTHSSKNSVPRYGFSS